MLARPAAARGNARAQRDGCRRSRVCTAPPSRGAGRQGGRRATGGADRGKPREGVVADPLCSRTLPAGRAHDRDPGVHRGARRGRHPQPLHHAEGGQPGGRTGWAGVAAPGSSTPSCPAPVSLGVLQNKKNTPERMELMKFNKYLRRMTLHKEVRGGRAACCRGGAAGGAAAGGVGHGGRWMWSDHHRAGFGARSAAATYRLLLPALLAPPRAAPFPCRSSKQQSGGQQASVALGQSSRHTASLAPPVVRWPSSSSSLYPSLCSLASLSSLCSSLSTHPTPNQPQTATPPCSPLLACKRAPSQGGRSVGGVTGSIRVVTVVVGAALPGPCSRRPVAAGLVRSGSRRRRAVTACLGRQLSQQRAPGATSGVARGPAVRQAAGGVPDKGWGDGWGGRGAGRPPWTTGGRASIGWR